MEWAPDEPLLWGVVFLLVFLVEVAIILNLKRHRSGRTYTRPSQEAVLAEGEELTDILSRFVYHDGERVGETVGMDGPLVIVKAAKPPMYRAVPRAALEIREDGLHVTSEVDWAEAGARGEEWRERQHRLVTYQEEELPEDERSAKVG